MAKVKILLSLDDDIAERLKQYAYENHKTVSASVTDWILKEKVKNTQLRGQLSIQSIVK